MKVINLKIVQDGVIAIYNVNLIDTKSAYRIEVKFNQCLLISEDEYPFFSLAKLRGQLEEMNAFILCNGARIDVYPSAMSSVGEMAYELEMGKQATKLVNIFEPYDREAGIATFSAQKKYREIWIESLKNG